MRYDSHKELQNAAQQLKLYITCQTFIILSTLQEKLHLSIILHFYEPCMNTFFCVLSFN